MVCIPYNPDTGLFITNANFLSVAIHNAGPYSLERDAHNITFKKNAQVIYTHSPKSDTESM